MESSILARMPAVVLVAVLAIPTALVAQAPVKHHRYNLIDLGTFGGPSSYTNPAGNGGPYMNHQGAVVGSSQTPTPLPPNNNGFVMRRRPGCLSRLGMGRKRDHQLAFASGRRQLRQCRSDQRPRRGYGAVRNPVSSTPLRA
jgi:hypothetical protein